MAVTHRYRVADLHFSITFADNQENDITLLPSFEPFASANDGENTLFNITVDDTIALNRERELIRDFDTGNGHTLVYKLAHGGYQYIIRDIKGNSCCLLQTDKDFNECCCALNGTHDMRSFGLNNAIMLVFAFAGSSRMALLIHASCVVKDGRAYPFIAKSGTGKSTHSSLWIKHIADCELINDDNPVVRVIDGKVILFGSPWSGKTPCYKNAHATLGAITRIERAPANSIEQLGVAQAFASFLPACSSMKWDTAIYKNICDTIAFIISAVPSYTLHCLPDEEAALLCYNTIKA